MSSTVSDENQSNRLPVSEAVSGSNVNVLRSSFDDKDTSRMASDTSSYVLGEPDDDTVVRRVNERNGSMENLVNFSANQSSNRSSRATETAEGAATASADTLATDNSVRLHHSASTILERDEASYSISDDSRAEQGGQTVANVSAWRAAAQLDCEAQVEEFSAEEEYELCRKFRRVTLCGLECTLQLDLVEPYRDILRHGGYVDSTCAVVTFSLDRIPPRSIQNYQAVLENVFYYVASTLEQMIVENYILVVLNSSSSSETAHVDLPSINWLRTHHNLVDRRLRKSLKLAIFYNASFRIRTIVTLVSLFVSSKLKKKLHYVRTHEELARFVPLDKVHLPKEPKLTENQARGRTGTVDCDTLREPVVASQLARRGGSDACDTAEGRRATITF